MTESPDSASRRNKLVAKLPRFITKRLPGNDSASTREVMVKTLDMEDEREKSDLSGKEQKMLRNLLDFGSKRIEDVMVPRVDIKAIEINQPISRLIQLFHTARHSRLPVYSEILDDPRGMVHVKDLLEWLINESKETTTQALSKISARTTASGQKLSLVETSPDQANEDQQIQMLEDAFDLNLENIDLSQSITSTKLIRDVLFVPPGMPALDLLHRMQAQRIHLALVIDEYGGIDGLVSIEDLVEEIVGEIEDEHDIEENALKIFGSLEKGLTLSGRTGIEELEEFLGFELEMPDENDDIESVGGLVVALSGKVPSRGQIFLLNPDLEFEVLDVDARKIKRLALRRNRKLGI